MTSSCVLCSFPQSTGGGWWLEDGPFTWLAAAAQQRAVFLLMLNLFQLFFTAAGCIDLGGSRCSLDCCSQNGRASFKWMRKPAFSLDYLIWSECSLILTAVIGSLFLVSSGKNSITTFQHIVNQVIWKTTKPLAWAQTWDSTHSTEWTWFSRSSHEQD